MDFFSNPIVAIIVLIGVLVFVHELGHFLVGRMSGIAVEIFSLGFGPAIVNFRRGETQYRISWIPLGGYVKFYGALKSEQVPEDVKGREFYHAPLLARTLTIAAGPVANFVLAIFVYALLGMNGVSHPPPIVGEIIPDSPADQAGLQFGDRILSVNGAPVTYWKDLQRIISVAAGEALVFQLNRGGQTQQLTIVPNDVKDKYAGTGFSRGQIGITPGHLPSVITVRAGGPAWLAGFRTGDRLESMSVGGVTNPVKYYRVFERIIADLSDEQTVGITLKRPDGSGRTIETSVAVLKDIGHSMLTVKSDAPEYGLMGDDIITSWNGEPVSSQFDLRDKMLLNRQQKIELGIERGTQTLTVTAFGKESELQRADGKWTIFYLPIDFLGVLEQPEPIVEQYSNPVSALSYGLVEMLQQSAQVGTGLLGLLTGKMPMEALGGPISIAKVASDSVKMGWETFLTAMAIISINLGLLNLIPIPVLDGGQLVVIAMEAIRGRPMTELAMENYLKLGFVMVLALLGIATYNDISRFWTSMLKELMGILQ